MPELLEAVVIWSGPLGEPGVSCCVLAGVVKEERAGLLSVGLLRCCVDWRSVRPPCVVMLTVTLGLLWTLVPGAVLSPSWLLLVSVFIRTVVGVIDS